MSILDDTNSTPPPSTTPKRRFDEANLYAEEEAPTTQPKQECLAEDLINDVTPAIQVVSTPGWYDSGDITRSTPAQVVLSIAETRPAMPYQGAGVITVTGGSATLFSNPGCTAPVPASYGAAALRGGEPVYIRGTAAGPVTLQLSLTPSGNPQIIPHGPANATVQIQAINLVTPRIAVEDDSAWHDPDAPGRNKAARLRLSIAESQPAHAYTGQGQVSVLGGGAQLFRNPECTQAAQSFSANELRQGAPLYVQGTAVRELQVQLALTASGNPQVRELGPVAQALTIQPVNIVTPHVQLIENTGWLQGDRGHAAPACIDVWYTESTGAPSYGGGGEILFDDKKLELFDDEKCQAPANKKIPNGTTEGHKKRFFVRGKTVDTHAISLKLDPSGNPQVRAIERQDAQLEVKQAKLVKPCIEAEYRVLLVPHRLLSHEGKPKSDHPTDLTRLELSLEQDQPGITYTGGAKLSFGTNVELFTDAAGDKPAPGFDGKNLEIEAKELTTGKKATLYLRAKGAGQIQVTLTPDATSKLGALAQRSIFVVTEAVLAMEAVQFDLELYEHSKPHSKVFRDPQAPGATRLTDEQKVKRGGLVQVQENGHHCRAKVVVKKPADAVWTVGGADHKVVLQQASQSGGVKLFKGDVEQAWPLELARADFGAGDVILSIEGSAATHDFRHVCIDVGLNRGAGGLAHTAKRNGDFALVTVVAFEKITPDTADYKQYINLPAVNTNPERGRKLKSQAKLTKPLQDVEILFTLIPGNTNQANLPDRMKYQEPKDTDAAVKTNAQGIATSAELELSRFTSDTFTIAAYVKQAPPVKNSAPPASCSKPIEVWQEVFYKYATMKQDTNVPYTDKSNVLENGFGQNKLKVTSLAPVAEPAHQRYLKAVDSQVWMANVLGVAGPRQMNIALIDTILGNEKDTAFDWNNLSFAPASIDLFQTFDNSNLANKGTWLNSATCQVTWNGAPVSMNHAVTLTPAGGGGHTLAWDLSALAPYTGNGTVNISITLAPTNGAPFTVNGANLNPAAGNTPIAPGALFNLGAWLISATCSVAAGAAPPADISATTTLTETNGVFKLAWSTPALAPFNGAGTAAVSFHLKEYPVLSGISWGPTTIVGMRFRQNTVGQPDENTVLHEAGHYLGLAASTLPDTGGTGNGRYYFLNGAHCNSNGNTCIMYDTVSPSVVFCDTCKDAIKGRDYTNPPVAGSAPF
ncbi:zinc-dependent metalloprotease [Hyalangium versicolor]|uniref:zinc-dependent metalloprotease n=1 Tax=Hyalangium versicolor TaxID=2861190 RepID=UPI001CCAB78E|nr:zinc-dependent metalloprotease [Hyalangium versicolor]